MDTEKDEFILNTRAVISGEIEIHGIEETSVKFNISKWVLEQFYEPKAPTKRPMEAVQVVPPQGVPIKKRVLTLYIRGRPKDEISEIVQIPIERVKQCIKAYKALRASKSGAKVPPKPRNVTRPVEVYQQDVKDEQTVDFDDAFEDILKEAKL